MKILLSEKSIAVIALVMLLSLSAVASITILAYAAPQKDPNVFVAGEGSVRLTWKSGKSQTYYSDAYANFGGLDTVTIIPNHGWNISAVEIDGISQTIKDEDGFTLINVQAKNMISVAFQKNPGRDDVETGPYVEAYPCPDVGLIFCYVYIGGDAHAYAIEWAQYALQIWDIYTTEDVIFGGDVEVILVFNLTEVWEAGLDPLKLKLWRTEVWLVRADVNEDGVVDGTDVSIVANANPSDPGWERLDQNGDGIINDEDVNIVNNYIGETVWEDVFIEVVVDVPNDLVYVHGETDHFSIFGAH